MKRFTLPVRQAGAKTQGRKEGAKKKYIILCAFSASPRLPAEAASA